MNQILLGVAGVVGLAVVGVLGLAASKPASLSFERTIHIDAAPADVTPYMEDLRLVNAWSPWNERDPNLTQTWSESTVGVGAWYAWDGNGDVGAGKQSTTASEPGRVTHHLEFLRPFADEADATLRWEADGEGTEVGWTFQKDTSAFSAKLLMVFMDLEAMIGPDYDKGLAKLKPMVEEAAAARIAAEAEAAAAAEAGAADAAAEAANGAGDAMPEGEGAADGEAAAME